MVSPEHAKGFERSTVSASRPRSAILISRGFVCCWVSVTVCLLTALYLCGVGVSSVQYVIHRQGVEYGLPVPGFPYLHIALGVSGALPLLCSRAWTLRLVFNTHLVWLWNCLCVLGMSVYIAAYLNDMLPPPLRYELRGYTSGGAYRFGTGTGWDLSWDGVMLIWSWKFQLVVLAFFGALALQMTAARLFRKAAATGLREQICVSCNYSLDTQGQCAECGRRYRIEGK